MAFADYMCANLRIGVLKARAGSATTTRNPPRRWDLASASVAPCRSAMALTIAKPRPLLEASAPLIR